MKNNAGIILLGAALFCVGLLSEAKAATLTSIECPSGYGMALPVDDKPITVASCFKIDDEMRSSLEAEEKARQSKVTDCPQGYAFQEESVILPPTDKNEKPVEPTEIKGKCIPVPQEAQPMSCPPGFAVVGSENPYDHKGGTDKKATEQALRCVRL